MAHPYARQLAQRLTVRPEGRVSLKARTLVKGFGYQRRTDGVVKEILSELESCAINTDLSSDRPPSLDDRVMLSLTAPVASKSQTASAGRVDLADVVQSVIPASVMVTTATGVGSGFIVASDGLVVTARHVVLDEDGESEREVDVHLSTGHKHRAVVFRSHRTLDFALLWIKEGGPFATVSIGNPRGLRFAETLLAIGAPSALRNTVARGIVSNPSQVVRFIDYIQTDAAIDHGNSGGPLIDQSGHVVGVNVWVLKNVDAARFALPIDYLTSDIAAAIASGRDACLAATYCCDCGYNDPGARSWYCRNCGRQSRSEPDSTTA